MIPVLLAPEQVTVTSGADPMVDITLRNGALFFPELDDLSNPNVLFDNRVAPVSLAGTSSTASRTSSGRRCRSGSPARGTSRPTARHW